MIKVSSNPVFDTVAKMAVVVVGMFAFVFVVMVPLYDVLCDALGINGKTSGEAYQAISVEVDESREIMDKDMAAGPGSSQVTKIGRESVLNSQPIDDDVSELGARRQPQRI